MTYEQILTEKDQGVLTITLNRPERLNAWTGQMGQELRAAFDARRRRRRGPRDHRHRGRPRLLRRRRPGGRR